MSLAWKRGGDLTPKRKETSANQKAGDNSAWKDDEDELILNVTREYTVVKSQEHDI